MKFTRLILIAVVSAFCLPGCEKTPSGPTPDIPGNGDNTATDTTETADPAIYAKGADISWITQMEEDGVKFYDAEGDETDCFELMKELGVNAIRLRVWVDPEEGWCGREDVLEKAAGA